MRVVEIFDSIDGEGIRAGELATFIRLAGCNLRCTYCDTSYALKYCDGKETTQDDVLKTVAEIGNRNITLTGGEPLLTKHGIELVHALSTAGYSVNIETNGSIDITPVLIERTIVTMDYKTPSSGVEDAMLLDNLQRLRGCDVLKFVAGESDLPRIKEILTNHYPVQSPYIYLSPVFGKIKPERLVEFLKELREAGINTKKARVQLQMHKYIWNPSKKGV